MPRNAVIWREQKDSSRLQLTLRILKTIYKVHGKRGGMMLLSGRKEQRQEQNAIRSFVSAATNTERMLANMRERSRFCTAKR